MTGVPEWLTYFTMPTEISSIPADRLTGTEKLLYGLVKSISGMREKKCYLTNEELGTILGLTERGARKAIYNLVESGLITVTDMGNKRCLNVVTPVPVVPGDPTGSGNLAGSGKVTPQGQVDDPTGSPHIEEKEYKEESTLSREKSPLEMAPAVSRKRNPQNGKVEDFEKRFAMFWNDYYPKRPGKKYHNNRKGVLDWFKKNVNTTDDMRLILFAAKKYGEEDGDVQRGFAQDPLTWLRAGNWINYEQDFIAYLNRQKAPDKRDTTSALSMLTRGGGK